MHAQTSRHCSLEDLMEEYEMQVHKSADKQILKKVVGHIEVCPEVAHVVKRLDDIILHQLDHLEYQDDDYVIKGVLIMMMEKTT